MVTVLRQAEFRIAIYLNDHLPEHVHVYGDGEARIELGSSDGPVRVISSFAMKAGDLRRAVRIIEDHKEMLRRRWRELHG